MLLLISDWLLCHWGFGYLMGFGVFVIMSFSTNYQAEARKLSAIFARTFCSLLYFCKDFSKTVMATGESSAGSSQSSALSSEQLQLVSAAVKEGMKGKLSLLQRELG